MGRLAATVILASSAAALGGCAHLEAVCDQPTLLAAGTGAAIVVAPDRPVTGVERARRVAVGAGYACAVELGGTVRCWPLPGPSGADPLARIVPGLREVESLAAGKTRACARHRDGSVSCWRFAAGRALDLGPIAGWADVRALAMSGAADHVCAIAGDGRLRCRGAGSVADLGSSGRVDDTGGAKAPWEPLGQVTAAAVSGRHACVRVGRAGAVRCWGAGYRGPELVPGLVLPRDVYAGEGVSCATLDDGTVRCWGEPGRVGDGSRASAGGTLDMPRALPSLRGTLKLALGQASCALLGDGTVRCWGPNQHGEVGDASLEPRTAPVAVCGLREAIDVGAGAQTCAAVRSGRVYCWGYRIPMAR